MGKAPWQRVAPAEGRRIEEGRKEGRYDRRKEGRGRKEGEERIIRRLEQRDGRKEWRPFPSFLPALLPFVLRKD